MGTVSSAEAGISPAFGGSQWPGDHRPQTPALHALQCVHLSASDWAAFYSRLTRVQDERILAGLAGYATDDKVVGQWLGEAPPAEEVEEVRLVYHVRSRSPSKCRTKLSPILL